MNEIKVLINFEKRIIDTRGVCLTENDYNSTKIIFDFDRQDGTKIFELKNPKNELVFSKEIVNNEVILAKENEDGTYSSLFDMNGDYIFEVSFYDGNSKLTSDYGVLHVELEQVVIGDEVVDVYLPIFDELMQKINTAITETDNLNISAEKIDDITIVNVTKKDGYVETIEIFDGIDGKDYILTNEDKEEIVETTKPLVESAIQPTLNNIEDIAEHAEVIARGRATGYVFNKVEDLDLWLQDSENISQLVLGDNFYIVATDVPDYWWDGSQKRVLETEKPDLKEYAKKEQFVTLTQAEYDALETKSANTYYFIPEEE